MIKTINLYVPTEWDDITFRQYRFLLDAQRRYNMEDEIEQLEYRVEQIHILNPDLDIEDIRHMTMIQAKDYFNEINVLYDKEPVKREVKDLLIGDKIYRLLDFKHLSLAQWIDAEKYSDVLMSHKLVAIFYIHPDEYNDIELDKVAEYIDNRPATEAFYLISQFFFIQKLLEKTMELYTERIQKQVKQIEKIKMLNERLRNRFSFRSFTTSPIMTWLKLKKSSE